MSAVVDWSDVRYRHRATGERASITTADPSFAKCTIVGQSNHVNASNDFGLLDHLLREEGFQPMDPLPAAGRAHVLRQAARA